MSVTALLLPTTIGAISGTVPALALLPTNRKEVLGSEAIENGGAFTQLRFVGDNDP